MRNYDARLQRQECCSRHSATECVCVARRRVLRRARVLHSAAEQGAQPVSFFRGKFSLLSCRCRGVFAPQTRVPTLFIFFCVHVLLLVGRCEFRPK